jgi:hypothetical protein
MSDITTQVRAYRSQIIDHLTASGCARELAAEVAREAFITATQTTVKGLSKEDRAKYLCAIADRLLMARHAAMAKEAPAIAVAPLG